MVVDAPGSEEVDRAEQVVGRSPMAFCVSIRSPSRHDVSQARTFGSPSTRTRQAAHEPERQKGPRGRWYLVLRLEMGRPAASRADVTLSPERAGMRSPSTRMAQSGRNRGSANRAIARQDNSEPARHN